MELTTRWGTTSCAASQLPQRLGQHNFYNLPPMKMYGTAAPSVKKKLCANIGTRKHHESIVLFIASISISNRLRLVSVKVISW